MKKYMLILLNKHCTRDEYHYEIWQLISVPPPNEIVLTMESSDGQILVHRRFQRLESELEPESCFVAIGAAYEVLYKEISCQKMKQEEVRPPRRVLEVNRCQNLERNQL